MVRVPFRDAEVITVGSQAWGHTLAQMLMMTSAEVVAGPALTPVSAERRALTIRAALDDRPVDLVTHAPKLFGLPLELLLDPIFVATRADQIDQLLFTGWAAPTGMSPGHPLTGRGGGGETTHLSVIDQEGVMVALTTTLGPHFGVGICCPETGLLFAQSKMTLPAPNPGAPDVAEVCPVILGRNGKPFACIGAAGGTRTPGAVLQVITNVIDGGMDIAAAIAAPRVNWWQHELRVHASAGEAVINRLRRAAPGLQIVADEVEYHLGVVQGAMIGTDGQAIGAADPGYDGVALAL
jgi:gamma-glutamyltranspeptidase/glutathione hydrolase